MKRYVLCLILFLTTIMMFPVSSGNCEPLWHPWTGPGDSLVLHQGPSAFKEGTFEGTHLSGSAVKLTAPSLRGRGYYLSPVITLPYQAEWVIPSWNIRCSKNEGWLVEVQVRSCDRELSPWLYLGSEGIAPPVQKNEDFCPWAKVNIDNIRLTRPVMEARYRVTMQGKESSPSLKLFAIAFRLAPPVPESELSPCLMPYSLPLPVPYRSQNAEEKEIASRICCPASTSMVLQYLGINRPTQEIASMLYSREHDLYGIWWKPPQLACQLGLKGWVRLFSSWEEAQQVIAEGQPIIASISYGKGELQNAPVSSTRGHLTVITGFDREGHVCVNDPAGSSVEAQPLKYDRVEFGKAWFLHGGVAIILKK